jgi:serine/threonine protein kinase
MILKSLIDPAVTYRIDPDFTQPVGSGSEAVIHEVKNHREPLAIKLFRKPPSGLTVEKLLALKFIGDRLRHPALRLPVDVVDGGHVVVTRAASGDTLRNILDAGTPLSLDERLSFALSIARACAVVSAVTLPDVVLTDLKPGNVLADGTLTDLTDVAIFGVRSLADPSEVFDYLPGGVGTPGYRAPEWVENPALRPTREMAAFSLAVVLFEILTGFHPSEMVGSVGAYDLDSFVRHRLFVGYLDDPEEALGGLARRPQYATELPEAVQPLMWSAFFDTPRDRPTPDDWVSALEGWWNELHPPPDPVAVEEQAKSKTLRTRVFLGTLTSIVLAAAACSGAWWYFVGRHQPRELPPDPIVPAVFNKEILE